MSALFFRVSFPERVEQYRGLQKKAKAAGLSLTVKNGGYRRMPVFIFYVGRKGEDLKPSFSDLGEVAAYLEGQTA